MSPFEFILAMLMLIFGFVIAITAITKKKKGSGGNGELSDEDARILRDLHHSLAKMEKRIEDLETLLINRK